MQHIIKVRHEIENTTDKFLLVGNCHEVIAACDSNDEAQTRLKTEVPNIYESKWGSVKILAPGESASGSYSVLAPLTASQALVAEGEDIFSQFTKN